MSIGAKFIPFRPPRNLFVTQSGARIAARLRPRKRPPPPKSGEAEVLPKDLRVAYGKQVFFDEFAERGKFPVRYRFGNVFAQDLRNKRVQLFAV